MLRRASIFLFFLAVLVVLVNLFWWFYYDRTRSQLDDQLARRLTSTAAITAASISVDQIEGLVFGDLEAYAQTVSKLNQILESSDLAELFIIDENYRYLATTSTGGDSVYFLADLHSDQIDSVFSGEVSFLATPSYQVDKVILKSSLAPLIGQEGFPLAVLGVEASVDYFDALTELKTNLYYAAALSLLSILAVGLVFVFLQKKVAAAEEKLFMSQTQTFLGQMVAIVSHEIKNPLQIIRASAERLKKKTGAEEATYVLEEVDRLNAIVSGYLQFSTSGQSLLASEQPQKFNLNELIISLKKHLLEKYAGQNLVWLEGESSPEIEINGYPRSLRQVLLNLAINGVEASLSKNEKIEIGLFVDSKDRDKTVIRIVDHGRGLSRKEIDKIFEPFYTTGQTGSGLGLYLSRKIIGEMGGQISVASKKNIGTTVTIDLPSEKKK